MLTVPANPFCCFPDANEVDNSGGKRICLSGIPILEHIMQSMINRDYLLFSISCIHVPVIWYSDGQGSHLGTFIVYTVQIEVEYKSKCIWVIQFESVPWSHHKGFFLNVCCSLLNLLHKIDVIFVSAHQLFSLFLLAYMQCLLACKILCPLLLK